MFKKKNTQKTKTVHKIYQSQQWPKSTKRITLTEEDYIFLKDSARPQTQMQRSLWSDLIRAVHKMAS